MNLCDETITVFNARDDPDRDVCVPTLICGVSWFCEIASTVDEGLQAANRYIIRIPVDADFGGKRYVEPADWPTALEAFTLQNGDIIVKGDATSVQNPRPATIKTLFPEMVTILGVTDNRRAPEAPHWKIVGS